MKKRASINKTKPQPRRPKQPQNGLPNRYEQFQFSFPYEFLLLCSLMEVSPQQVVKDFADNLACGSWHRQVRDAAKEHLMNYFISHGYGGHLYSEEDIRAIFKQMGAVGLLFPDNGGDKLIDLYSQWRSAYQHYWFNKWRSKPRRSPLQNSLP